MVIQAHIYMKLVIRISVASHRLVVIQNSTMFMNVCVWVVLTHFTWMHLSLQKITEISYITQATKRHGIRMVCVWCVSAWEYSTSNRSISRAERNDTGAIKLHWMLLNQKHTPCLDMITQTLSSLVRLVMYLHLNISTPSTYTSFSTLIWQQKQSTSGFVLLTASNLAQMWHSMYVTAFCQLRGNIYCIFFNPFCSGIIIADGHFQCYSSWNSWLGKMRNKYDVLGETGKRSLHASTKCDILYFSTCLKHKPV